MKKYVVTAAALMLGTSALAWTPAEDVHTGVMQAGTAIGAMDAGKAPFAASKDKGATKMQTAASWTAGGDGKKAFAGLDDSLVETAAAEGFKGSADAAAVIPAVETAAWDGKKDAATASTGMGGPLEPVGDGGKDTPADEDHGAMDHGAHGTMPADATAEAKPAATADMAADAAAAVKPAATEATATPGVGGPVEARNDYPPCRPGRGDDNCIQLYERGMTGRKD